MAKSVEQDRRLNRFWSKHQKSEALDIRTSNLTPTQITTLIVALRNASTSTILKEPTKCFRSNNQRNSNTPGEGVCAREHIHLSVPSKYLPNT